MFQQIITRENFQDFKNDLNVKFKVFQLKQQEFIQNDRQAVTLRKEIEDLKLLQGFLNKIINNKQTDYIKRVIAIVSLGLQTVLEDPTIKLDLKESLKRNQKFYEFQIAYEKFSVPCTEVGGGLINLLSFLLRITLLSLSKNRRFLVLDESFANLSTGYREKIGDFLKILVEKTGVQLFLVSHQIELDEAADKLLSIHKKGDTVVID